MKPRFMLLVFLIPNLACELEEVIDFYNERSGVGIGIELSNQTLPFDKLNLNKNEKKDIIAFFKKLTDTSSFNQNEAVNAAR